ncbi:response regulator transcription factor [Planobispora takensis]|uniref:HTH luxR-type domain-containing protein n=1 Tax=Planobispora takensis TaxID=1367882 RepID=A0A8J3SQ12_9ACTN|nr:helix-turn-helix transcriptional regulator [Planobispora takensis]GIH98197.1 hypothetical protein Pta02_02060 [Planobispora takensis]
MVMTTTGKPSLSTRESEVLQLLADGCTYQQIAHRLGISVHTVNTHLRRIRAKSGVCTKVELAKLVFTGRVQAQ